MAVKRWNSYPGRKVQGIPKFRLRPSASATLFVSNYLRFDPSPLQATGNSNLNQPAQEPALPGISTRIAIVTHEFVSIHGRTREPIVSDLHRHEFFCRTGANKEFREERESEGSDRLKAVASNVVD
jgi:hypothetical protein